MISVTEEKTHLFVIYLHVGGKESVSNAGLSRLFIHGFKEVMKGSRDEAIHVGIGALPFGKLQQIRENNVCCQYRI